MTSYSQKRTQNNIKGNSAYKKARTRRVFRPPKYPAIIITQDFDTDHIHSLGQRLDLQQIPIFIQSSVKKLKIQSGMPTDRFFIVLDDSKPGYQLTGQFLSNPQLQNRIVVKYPKQNQEEQVVALFQEHMGLGSYEDEIIEEGGSERGAYSNYQSSHYMGEENGSMKRSLVTSNVGRGFDPSGPEMGSQVYAMKASGANSSGKNSSPIKLRTISKFNIQQIMDKAERDTASQLAVFIIYQNQHQSKKFKKYVQSLRSKGQVLDYKQLKKMNLRKRQIIKISLTYQYQRVLKAIKAEEDSKKMKIRKYVLLGEYAVRKFTEEFKNADEILVFCDSEKACMKAIKDNSEDNVTNATTIEEQMDGLIKQRDFLRGFDYNEASEEPFFLRVASKDMTMKSLSPSGVGRGRRMQSTVSLNFGDSTQPETVALPRFQNENSPSHQTQILTQKKTTMGPSQAYTPKGPSYNLIYPEESHLIMQGAPHSEKVQKYDRSDYALHEVEQQQDDERSVKEQLKSPYSKKNKPLTDRKIKLVISRNSQSEDEYQNSPRKKGAIVKFTSIDKQEKSNKGIARKYKTNTLQVPKKQQGLPEQGENQKKETSFLQINQKRVSIHSQDPSDLGISAINLGEEYLTSEQSQTKAQYKPSMNFLETKNQQSKQKVKYMRPIRKGSQIVNIPSNSLIGILMGNGNKGDYERFDELQKQLEAEKQKSKKAELQDIALANQKQKQLEAQRQKLKQQVKQMEKKLQEQSQKEKRQLSKQQKKHDQQGTKRKQDQERVKKLKQQSEESKQNQLDLQKNTLVQQKRQLEQKLKDEQLKRKQAEQSRQKQKQERLKDKEQFDSKQSQLVGQFLKNQKERQMERLKHLNDLEQRQKQLDMENLKRKRSHQLKQQELQALKIAQQKQKVKQVQSDEEKARDTPSKKPLNAEKTSLQSSTANLPHQSKRHQQRSTRQIKPSVGINKSTDQAIQSSASESYFPKKNKNGNKQNAVPLRIRSNSQGQPKLEKKIFSKSKILSTTQLNLKSAKVQEDCQPSKNISKQSSSPHEYYSPSNNGRVIGDYGFGCDRSQQPMTFSKVPVFPNMIASPNQESERSFPKRYLSEQNNSERYKNHSPLEINLDQYDKFFENGLTVYRKKPQFVGRTATASSSRNHERETPSKRLSRSKQNKNYPGFGGDKEKATQNQCSIIKKDSSSNKEPSNGSCLSRLIQARPQNNYFTEDYAFGNSQDCQQTPKWEDKRRPLASLGSNYIQKTDQKLADTAKIKKTNKPKDCQSLYIVPRSLMSTSVPQKLQKVMNNKDSLFSYINPSHMLNQIQQSELIYDVIFNFLEQGGFQTLKQLPIYSKLQDFQNLYFVEVTRNKPRKLKGKEITVNSPSDLPIIAHNLANGITDLNRMNFPNKNSQLSGVSENRIIFYKKFNKILGKMIAEIQQEESKEEGSRSKFIKSSFFLPEQITHKLEGLQVETLKQVSIVTDEVGLEDLIESMTNYLKTKRKGLQIQILVVPKGQYYRYSYRKYCGMQVQDLNELGILINWFTPAQLGVEQVTERSSSQRGPIVRQQTY